MAQSCQLESVIRDFQCNQNNVEALCLDSYGLITNRSDPTFFDNRVLLLVEAIQRKSDWEAIGIYPNFWRNISNAVQTRIFEAVGRLPHLKCLHFFMEDSDDMQDSNLNSKNLQHIELHLIAKAIGHPYNNRLEELFFEECFLMGDNNDIASFHRALEGCCLLQILHLYRTRIPVNFRHFITILSQHPNVKVLVLEDCGLTDHQGIMIANRMKTQFHKLKELCLCDNKIGSSSISSLMHVLAQNSVLKELNICGNAIGTCGAFEIARMLKQNCSLEKLEVAGCGIKDDGCVALADALKYHNQNVRSLNISENLDITDQIGYYALADALKYNFTVTELYHDCTNKELNKKYTFYLNLNSCNRGNILRNDFTDVTRDKYIHSTIISSANNMEDLCTFSTSYYWIREKFTIFCAEPQEGQS